MEQTHYRSLLARHAGVQRQHLGRVKGQNFYDNLLDLTSSIFADGPKLPNY